MSDTVTAVANRDSATSTAGRPVGAGSVERGGVMNDQVAGRGIELDEAGVVFSYDWQWFAGGVR